MQHVGFQPTSDRSGVKVVLETEVLQTVSSLQIGVKTLATRVGGIIGVGKELLWILIFCFTTVSTFIITGYNVLIKRRKVNSNKA